MTIDGRLVGYELLEKGVLVPFHVVDEQIITGPDEAEFAVQLELVVDEEDDIDGTDALAIGAFGFIFLIASLSFTDARPRGSSLPDFDELDEFGIGDLMDGLRYDDGNLIYYGDYIRGRRVKTDITVRRDGTIRLRTTGRGKAVIRWLDRIQGKKPLAVVIGNEGEV